MAGLKIRVMKTVSEGTKKIIMRRARMEGLDILFHENAALALCNGNVCDLIYASDLAQKASDVEVFVAPKSHLLFVYPNIVSIDIVCDLVFYFVPQIR